MRIKEPKCVTFHHPPYFEHRNLHRARRLPINEFEIHYIVYHVPMQKDWGSMMCCMINN